MLYIIMYNIQSFIFSPHNVLMYYIYIYIYIYGSVHGESNLITVQQDATYSVYYISVGSSTCFGC